MCRITEPPLEKDIENENVHEETADSGNEKGPLGSSTSSEKSRVPNMMETAPFFSRILFHWPYALLKLGLERPLEEHDLPEIMQVDSSSYNYQYFEKLWGSEQARNPDKPSLHRAFLRDFFGSLWHIQPLMCLGAAAKIVQAVALGLLIESFETGIASDGYKWASLLVFCGVVILFEHHHVFFITWRKGMQLRISCVASIYAKSLRLSSTHQETNASAGKIMNLASNDVERFLMAALFINYLVWSPLQAVAILVVGWFFDWTCVCRRVCLASFWICSISILFESKICLFSE